MPDKIDEVIEESVMEGLKAIGLDPEHWPDFSYKLIPEVKDAAAQRDAERPSMKICLGASST